MLDLFLLIVIAWSLISGWRNGALREVASSVGVFFGLVVAAQAYDKLGAYLAIEGTQANMATSIVAFLILWIVVPIGLGAAASLLTKALEGLQLGWLNRLLGALMSFIKYFLLIGCLLSVLSWLGILNDQRTKDSYLYAPIQANFSAFWREALRPEHSEAYRSLQTSDSAIDGTESDTTWIDVSSLR